MKVGQAAFISQKFSDNIDLVIQSVEKASYTASIKGTVETVVVNKKTGKINGQDFYAVLIEEKNNEEEELLYIDFRNAKKNHNSDRVYFRSDDYDTANAEAREWCLKNFESFDPDCINIVW